MGANTLVGRTLPRPNAGHTVIVDFRPEDRSEGGICAVNTNDLKPEHCRMLESALALVDPDISVSGSSSWDLWLDIEAHRTPLPATVEAILTLWET